MKTLVTILAIQLFVGAAALAAAKDDAAAVDSGLQNSVASSVQQGGNFNEDLAEKNRVKEFVTSLLDEENVGGSGSGGGSTSRTGSTSTPRPRGNDWTGPANR